MKPHAQTNCPTCKKALPDEGPIAYFKKQETMTHEGCADRYAQQSTKPGHPEWSQYHRVTVSEAIDWMFGKAPESKGTLDDVFPMGSYQGPKRIPPLGPGAI